MNKIENDVVVLRTLLDYLKDDKFVIMVEPNSNHDKNEEESLSTVHARKSYSLTKNWAQVHKVQVYITAYKQEIDEAINRIISIPEHFDIRKTLIETLKYFEENTVYQLDRYTHEELIKNLDDYLNYIEGIFGLPTYDTEKS